MNHTVLVCDDAIFMRTMISDILTQAGFEIVGEAETGAQAVEKYKSLRPDLVTMDIVMPDMGGKELADRIRKSRPGLPILYISGYVDQPENHDPLLGESLLQKPFGLSEILKRVKQILRVRI